MSLELYLELYLELCLELYLELYLLYLREMAEGPDYIGVEA